MIFILRLIPDKFLNIPISDINQERIVQEGGLDALLKLVESSHNTTILRVASGAIANLAMNGIPKPKQVLYI